MVILLTNVDQFVFLPAEIRRTKSPIGLRRAHNRSIVLQVFIIVCSHTMEMPSSSHGYSDWKILGLQHSTDSIHSRQTIIFVNRIVIVNSGWLYCVHLPPPFHQNNIRHKALCIKIYFCVVKTERSF